MKTCYLDLLGSMDAGRMMRHTAELTEIEKGQTSECFLRSAEYVASVLKHEGIPNVELLSFPADGRTVYQDKRMPMAWSVTTGRLTLLNADAGASENSLFAPASDESTVAADYGRHPFHLIHGSTAVAEGGVVARIITEAQLLAGEDPRGCMVMLEPLTWPRAAVLTPILDLGALGFITDFLTGRYETPDSIQWVNACTEGAHWHIQGDDRPFVGFSVSPRTGDRIRKMASAKELKARVECDGRRYAGILPAVTARIPGKRNEEVWMTAHLFEPLASDNSNGVASVIETARQICLRGTPEFSVRLLFCMELYGFAAYAASRGDSLRKEVLGGCNFDSVLSEKGRGIKLSMAGAGTPFYGNALLEQLTRSLNDCSQAPEIELSPYGAYFDELFLCDPTIGVPMVWPFGKNAGFWHNSIQTIDRFDRETYAEGTAFCAAFVWQLCNPEKRLFQEASALAQEHLNEERKRIGTRPFGSDAERMAHCFRREKERLENAVRFLPGLDTAPALAELEALYRKLSGDLVARIPVSGWRSYAAGIIPFRSEPGFPYDLARVPKRKRAALPDSVIYGPFANVLANMDGHTDLGTLIRLAEYETGGALPEKTVKRYVNAVCFLMDHGYLGGSNRNELSESDLVKALHRLGVKHGDLLLVHSAVSAFGHIAGGAETVIDALKKAVGPSGTVLFPMFTRPYLHLGGTVNRGWNYRPFDPSDPYQIWVGSVPQTLLLNYPDVCRSAHITHSWGGFGPLAEECLKHHGAYDPPASKNSPLGEALEHGGKVLHFGSGVNSTTFLHYFEDHFDLPFLDSVLCTVKGRGGRPEKVLIPKHLPGDRDFYHGDGEKSKFFRRAFAAGLTVRKETLGLGQLQLMELSELFDIGSGLVREDPRIFLCDDPECLFCASYP